MSCPSNNAVQHMHTVPVSTEVGMGQLLQQTWEDKGRHHGTAGTIHMDNACPRPFFLLDLACMHAMLLTWQGIMAVPLFPVYQGASWHVK